MLDPGPHPRRCKRGDPPSSGSGRSRRRLCPTAAVAVLVLALAAPSAGAANTTLPVGEANGVRVVRERGAIVVVFTKRAGRLYRRVAGNLVSVSCTELIREDGPGFGGTNSGEVTIRAPKRRRRLRTGDLTRGMDYCRVWLAARTVGRGRERHRQSRQLIVSVPLTQRGAVYLDEQSKAFDLLGVLLFIAVEADKRKWDDYPTPAELLEALADYDRRARIVALGSPSDTPQTGAIGYYSDGQQHAAVVNVSASGRRLFFEVEPDGAIHTNVAGYIYGDIE
jgi:hypothetical protein